jgi:hypothetical protein
MRISINKTKQACKWSTNVDEISRENVFGYTEYCAVDIIHHFLRKLDALEIELVTELESIDATHIYTNQCFDFKNQPMLTRYLDFISNEIGLNDLIIARENGFSIRRLSGNEKVQFLEKIDFQKLFPRDILENNGKIQSVNK